VKLTSDKLSSNEEINHRFMKNAPIVFYNETRGQTRKYFLTNPYIPYVNGVATARILPYIQVTNSGNFILNTNPSQKLDVILPNQFTAQPFTFKTRGAGILSFQFNIVNSYSVNAYTISTTSTRTGVTQTYTGTGSITLADPEYIITITFNANLNTNYYNAYNTIQPYINKIRLWYDRETNVIMRNYRIGDFFKTTWYNEWHSSSGGVTAHYWAWDGVNVFMILINSAWGNPLEKYGYPYGSLILEREPFRGIGSDIYAYHGVVNINPLIFIFMGIFGVIGMVVGAFILGPALAAATAASTAAVALTEAISFTTIMAIEGAVTAEIAAMTTVAAATAVAATEAMAAGVTSAALASVVVRVVADAVEIGIVISDSARAGSIDMALAEADRQRLLKYAASSAAIGVVLTTRNMGLDATDTTISTAASNGGAAGSVAGEAAGTAAGNAWTGGGVAEMCAINSAGMAGLGYGSLCTTNAAGAVTRVISFSENAIRAAVQGAAAGATAGANAADALSNTSQSAHTAAIISGAAAGAAAGANAAAKARGATIWDENGLGAAAAKAVQDVINVGMYDMNSIALVAASSVQGGLLNNIFDPLTYIRGSISWVWADYAIYGIGMARPYDIHLFIQEDQYPPEINNEYINKIKNRYMSAIKLGMFRIYMADTYNISASKANSYTTDIINLTTARDEVLNPLKKYISTNNSWVQIAAPPVLATNTNPAISSDLFPQLLSQSISTSFPDKQTSIITTALISVQYIYFSSGTSPFNLNQIAVIDKRGINVAAGKPAVVTTTLPVNITNGKYYTQISVQTFVLDLGAAYDISTISMYGFSSTTEVTLNIYKADKTWHGIPSNITDNQSLIQIGVNSYTIRVPSTTIPLYSIYFNMPFHDSCKPQHADVGTIVRYITMDVFGIKVCVTDTAGQILWDDIANGEFDLGEEHNIASIYVGDTTTSIISLKNAYRTAVPIPTPSSTAAVTIGTTTFTPTYRIYSFI
jgi:hypothetical protein